MDAKTADGGVTVAGRAFCFTGRGRVSRGEMEQQVRAMGGVVHARVTRKTDYLVVGDKGSKRWKLKASKGEAFWGEKSGSPGSEAFWGDKPGSPGSEAFWGDRCGRKLARALQLKSRGGDIRIVREEAFWQACG